MSLFMCLSGGTTIAQRKQVSWHAALHVAARAYNGDDCERLDATADAIRVRSGDADTDASERATHLRIAAPRPGLLLGRRTSDPTAHFRASGNLAVGLGVRSGEPMKSAQPRVDSISLKIAVRPISLGARGPGRKTDLVALTMEFTTLNGVQKI